MPLKLRKRSFSLIKAGELEVGDKLVSPNGKEFTVTSFSGEVTNTGTWVRVKTITKTAYGWDTHELVYDYKQKVAITLGGWRDV